MFLQLKWPFGATLVLAAALLAAPAHAQQATQDPTDWQSVITGQIEAFRTGEDAIALFYAGRAFRLTCRDPSVFVRYIRTSGYGPIIDSIGHAFGNFNLMNENAVMQVVRLSGGNLHSYEALYRLGLEPEGWKVYAVVVREVPGINI